VANAARACRERQQAEEATDAVMVVVGVIPAFVVAATIEGFVSGTSVPDVVEVSLGAVVAVAYVCFLFGFNPVRAWRIRAGRPI